MGLLDGQTDEYMMSLFIQQQLIIDTNDTGHDGIVYTIAENSLSELNINQNDIPLLTLNANSTTINQHLVVEGDTAFDGDFSVNTTVFHVNSTTGYVGIGTNAPTKLLHLYSDDVEANMLIESLDDNAVFVLNSNSGGSVASGINRESRIIFQEVGVQKTMLGYDPDDGKFGIQMGIAGSLVPTDFWIADDGSAGFGSDVSITDNLSVTTIDMGGDIDMNDEGLIFNGGTGVINSIFGNVDNTGRIGIKTNDVEKLSIGFTSSYVGVNNTTPAYTLDVGGDINATGTLTGVAATMSGLLTVSSNAIIGSVGEELEIGNIGFGNWAGIAHTNFATQTGYALIQNSVDGEVLINRPTGQSIKFNENNTAQMTILTGGNVGIGETSPDSLLQVGGGTSNTTRSDVCQLTGNATGSEAICLSLVNDAATTIGNATSMTFHNNFAHSPVGKIMVEATGSTANSDMIFSNYNGSLTERMRMTYDGFVGIGTSTPTVALDVVGDVNISGDLTVGGNFGSFNHRYRATAQSVANSTLTTMLYTTEEENDGGYTYNNGLITVPDDGTYHIAVKTSFVTNSSGYRYMNVINNTSGLSITSDTRAPVNGALTNMTCYAIVKLNSGNGIYVSAYQTSGGSLNVGGTASIARNYIQIRKM